MISASLVFQALAALTIGLSAAQGCPCHAHAEPAQPPPPAVPVEPDGPVLCDERSPLVWFCPVTLPIADCSRGSAVSQFDMTDPTDACLVRDPAGVGRPLLYRFARMPTSIPDLPPGFGIQVWVGGWLP